MIWRFVGGRSDGVEIDADDPPSNWSGEFTLPAPETLRLHSAKANRSVYRLVSATPDEAIYHLDPDLTRQARQMTRQEWEKDEADTCSLCGDSPVVERTESEGMVLRYCIDCTDGDWA